MKKLLLTSLVLAAPAQALAKPIYLVCQFPGNPDINITLDEGAGSASLFVPSTDHSEQFQATFTTDRVLFKDRMIGYSINRIDLSVDRTIFMINSTNSGKCRIMETPARAF